MYTKFDNRTALIKLVEKLDSADMKQILAYVAGYEAGKLERTPDQPVKVQISANHL